MALLSAQCFLLATWMHPNSSLICLYSPTLNMVLENLLRIDGDPGLSHRVGGGKQPRFFLAFLPPNNRQLA